MQPRARGRDERAAQPAERRCPREENRQRALHGHLREHAEYDLVLRACLDFVAGHLAAADGEKVRGKVKRERECKEREVNESREGGRQQRERRAGF